MRRAGALVALAAVLLAPQGALAGHMTAEDVIDLAVERSTAHGADPATVVRVLRCESTFDPHAVGSAGELGAGQWLAGGAWYETPAYRQGGVDVRALYRAGRDVEATWYDVDGLAWAMSARAPSGFARQWSCR